jgi:tetratricopeptide (TPR) repeat protein
VARDRGDPEGVITYCQQALDLYRTTGNVWDTAVALHNLGVAARYQGDYTRAEALLAEVLAVYHQNPAPGASADVLSSVGLVALEQEQYTRAQEAFTASLHAARTWMLGTVLEGLASVASGTGQAERAAHLFGAAESVRRVLSTPRWPANEALYQKYSALARAVLEERFARIWEEGRAMTAERAITYALETTAVR